MKFTSVTYSRIDNMLDPYEFKARLLPGLLLLLPAILFIAILYGSQSPAVVALSSVLAACGGPYLLSSFVRTWGVRAQDRLYRRWGAQPSTILLRHGDTQLPQQTKLRYHMLSTLRLRIVMPSVEEERKNPIQADQAYAAAADALRPLTNDCKIYPFVVKELVAYGFNRNAYGSRWVGLCVALITCVAVLLHAGALRLGSTYWSNTELDIAHILVLVISAGMAAIWCVHFTEDTVKLAGFSYAKRLLEALEKLPKQRPSNARAEQTEN